MFACLGKLVHSSFLQTVYHRFCQVKPNISPSRYPLALVATTMVILCKYWYPEVVLIKWWYWYWCSFGSCHGRYGEDIIDTEAFFFLFSGQLRSLFTCPRCNYFVWSTILKKIMWGVSRFINYELMHTKRSLYLKFILQ